MQQATGITQFSNASALRLLTQAAERLLASDNPYRDVLPELFSALQRDFGIDALFSYVLADSGTELRLAFHAGLNGSQAEDMAWLGLGQGVCGQAAASRQAVYASDEQMQDDPCFAAIQAGGFKAFACEPLVAQSRLLGTLAFATRGRDHYRKSELSFFGAIARLVASALERARATSELANSDMRQRLALDAADAGAWEWDVQSGDIVWSPKNFEIYGVDPAEGPPSYEARLGRMHPDDRARLERDLRQAIRSGGELRGEYRLIHPKHGERWIMAHGRVQRDAAGKATRIVGINIDITERKKKEENVRASEARFRASFEDAAVGIAHLATDGRLLQVNDRLCQITGHTRDELLVLSCKDLTPVEDQAEDIKQIDRILTGELASYARQKRIIRKDGALIWIASTVSLAQAREDQPDYLICTVEDITKAKEAETAARAELAASEHLRLALAAGRMGTWEADHINKIRRYSPEAQALLGLPADDPLPWDGRLKDVIPDDRAALALAQEAMRVGDDDGTIDYRIRLAHGGIRWLSVRGRVVERHADGTPVRTLGIITDITERKLADQRLRESEERYRMALETGRLGAFDWDIPADIVHWDDRSLATLGLEPGTVLDFKSAMAFSHPDDRASIESAVAHALDPKSGKSFMQEWRAVGPDGGVRWMETQGQALFTGEGEERRAHRLIGTVRDVTRRKAAESEFAESEARFRSTFENAAVGIAHVARDGRWLRVNDKLCQILGYTRDELLTRTVEEITHGEDIADGKIGTDRLLAGEIPSFTIEQRVTRKDGGTIWVAATISLAGKSDGSPDYFIAVIEDITKDKEAEAALAASEAKLRLILDAAQMGIFEMDFSTGFAEIDAQEARLLGLEREARRVAIADVHRRIHPDDLAIKKTLQAVSEPVGEPLQAEFRYRLADGTERWLASHSLALIDSETGSKRIVGVNFDVTERKRSEETRQLLTHELDHRVKNTLATVLAIAHQTLRQTRDPQTFVTSFEGRVRALARSHALLTRTSWSGADLAGLIGEQLAVGDPPHPQITIGGPDITLEPQTALHLALVLHELGTNARKHGALTSPAGRVAVTWTRTEEEGRPLLQLKWQESGGPDVTPPQNKGFGLSLIEGSLRGKIDANVDLRFEKSGVVCLIDIPFAEDK